MRCCVPLCGNTSNNVSTSEKTEITFHALPSEGNLRTAWLRTFGVQDPHLPNTAVVCSQHLVDDNFLNTNSSVREIHSNAVPSTVQMCMICLDTDSKLSLMSKHKLEEAYEQLTGLSLFQLCRRANLKQTLCVLCAQRLMNFSKFRDLSLRAHSLMTDLVEQYELNTIQHKELLNCTSAHLKCNLTQTTLGANHCDLYIDHTDEEEQTAAEESVVGGVATVVVKNEGSSDSMLSADNLELAQHNCASDDEYSDRSIKLESRLLDEAISKALGRKAFCFEDFVQEPAHKEHMSKHLQNAACASQVFEPRAAVNRSCDSLVLQNKTGSQRLNDVPPPAANSHSAAMFHATGSRKLNDVPLLAAADCAQPLVTPLFARLAASNENKVQATEEAGAIQKSEQILETNIGELDDRSSESGTKPYTDTNRFTDCVVQLYDIFKIPNKVVLGENQRMSLHTAAKPYSCTISNYKCSQKIDLFKQKITHTGEKPFSCEICNFKSAQKNKLLRHIRTHTGEKPFSCDMCNHKCARKDKLLQHIKTHTGEKPFSCEICNYKCARKNHLLQHIKTHTGEKPFSCEICNYKFAVKSNLLRHIKTHTGEKPFYCEICNNKFARKNNLLQHIKTHTGEKPFFCDMCDYKCAQKCQLLQHINTHTGKNLFSCEICNYKCSLKGNLLRHIKTHIGEKPFSCDMCNHKSAQKDNLLRHIRTHTGEKPFSCEICNYKCAQIGDLSRHIRTHTGEKPFSCEVCNYKCARKDKLLQHIKIHTGEKPFSCEVCNYKCTQKSKLLMHMRTHTSQEQL
ncbi:zinc finger protein 568-like [Bicyclus anynana]|uniref:Zinc finger protein 568-like n=1 Tax=Bicyclus anynana TaxID=110368 RepID=A0ABM3M2F4_BICAN|nr:zinc finger protein 568-like [Bicyclus anynana]